VSVDATAASFDLAKVAAEANYAAFTPIVYTFDAISMRVETVMFKDGTDYYASILVTQPEITIKSISNIVARAAKIYGIVSVPSDAYSNLYDSNSMPEFYDGKMSLIGVSVATTDSDIVSDFYGFLFASVPNWCTGSELESTSRGFSNTGKTDITPENFGAIIEWSFTPA